MPLFRKGENHLSFHIIDTEREPNTHIPYKS